MTAGAGIVRTLIGLLLAATTAGAARAADDPIQAAYVVLGENGAPTARVITTTAQCPSIQADGQILAMGVRSGPETVALRPTRSDPKDSKPSAFPVLTCEAFLPQGLVHASVAGHPLPLPAKALNRIVVIGDTGCRLKLSDDAYQACNAPNQYPFAKVAASAAAWKPDLVVHVGDYLYRENVCAVDKHPGCAASPWGYGWDAWNADFFTPGASLLAAAPWLAVRGNHESCNRAGQGWWRFVDPRPLAPGRDCNLAANDDMGDYSAPYAVPLGDGAQIISMDTSDTAADAIPPGDPMAAHYRQLAADVATLAAKAPYTIVASHHPLLGFTAMVDKTTQQTELRPSVPGLQSAFGAVNPWLFPHTVQLALAGHVHVWEQVSFSSPHPTQFITGFSGTQEDVVPIPRVLPADAYVAPGAAIEAFSSWVDGFGFMTMVRTGPTTWDVEVHDQNGAVVNRCKIEGRHSKCDLPQVSGPK
ncbi:MAG TPA: metallophosphoesterase [Caulobacteraceae bacterium]|nr:metallophosphoesterase [Caulobacteraceae bacterium]